MAPHERSFGRRPAGAARAASRAPTPTPSFSRGFAAAAASSSASASSRRDYYEELGVPRGADAAAIKKAYHALAKKYHPDANGGDAEAAARFQDVQRAYDCLKDPDIMREFFGGGAFGGGMGGMRREDGATVQVEVEVSLREAAKGLRRTISLPEVDAAGRQTGGVRQVELDIPAGVGSGVRLQMRGMGGPPRTGQGRAGDLLVQVRVRPDPTFERDGDDVHVEASVPFPTAALGGSVRVPTLDGDISMRVGAGTQGGAQLRLRARGMPRLRGGGRGDQFVHLKVDVPRRLTPRARELLEQLQEELTDGAAGDRAGGKRARAAGAY
eukprot:PRCOL_00006175-RA